MTETNTTGETEQEATEFKKGLAEALAKSVAAKSGVIVHEFLAYWFHSHKGKWPEMYDGSRDRTCGYHTVTTVLRTLGEDGLKGLMKCWLPFSEVETACREVLGHGVPPELEKGRIRGRLELEGEQRDTVADTPRPDERKALVDACTAASKAVRAVLKGETDHVMQHQLHCLISELEWCARAYGKEDGRK